LGFDDPRRIAIIRRGDGVCRSLFRPWVRVITDEGEGLVDGQSLPPPCSVPQPKGSTEESCEERQSANRTADDWGNGWSRVLGHELRRRGRRQRGKFHGGKCC
jgi:hypothetical protein